MLRAFARSKPLVCRPSSVVRSFSIEAEERSDVVDALPGAAEDATVIPSEGDKLRPPQVVERLNRYIIGQDKAKKAVAIALRNRWRRQKVTSADLRLEISPKNILMVGPTGCGKTEIARKLSKLAQAPFIKVEATKFTEVGFHGKDVEQIIKDLVENAIVLVKRKHQEKMKKQVTLKVQERILDLLVGEHAGEQSRETFRKLLSKGEMEDRNITIDVPRKHQQAAAITVEAHAPGIEEYAKNLTEALMKTQKTKRKLTIGAARPILEELEMDAMMQAADVAVEALALAEENGIVFIDEIDKVCQAADSYRGGADASAEGVQRDLLPLIEGSTVTTKHGQIQTDHILFIASGAFHTAKPSDLLAELQGRLPIRVELDALTEKDLFRILTEPVTNLIRQQKELLETEGIELIVTDAALREIARVAFEINRTIENIGARRLHTVVEKVVEDISFDASEMTSGSVVTIDKSFVVDKVGTLLHKTDLSKFIL